MRKWDRIKAIRDYSGLASNEKLVALMIISHWNQDYNQARLRRKTLIEDTGLSKNPLTQALKTLCDNDNIFKRVRTGRANIYRPGLFFPDYEEHKENRIVDVRECETSEVFDVGTSEDPFAHINSPDSTPGEEKYKLGTI